MAKKTKTLPQSTEEKEFFGNLGLRFDSMEPRGAWIDDLMKKKEAETGSTEFSAVEAYSNQRANNRGWTDGVNKLRRLRAAGEIDETTDPTIIEKELLEDMQRCLRSLRNGGNAVGNNGRTDIRSIPPDWSMPHEIPDGNDRYCSAVEFERRCIEVMGAETFEKWKQEHSKTEPKGKRRAKEEDYEVGGTKMVSEFAGVVELVDQESQTVVAEMRIDITPNTFDVRGPLDMSVETVTKGIHRFKAANHLAHELGVVEKVLMFRIPFKTKAA